MGHLYLVRHGQASFGADDYDQLSDLGRLQGQRLGAYWREHLAVPDGELKFDTVLIGSLKRHRQTWEAMAIGAGLQHTPEVWPGLDEYDSHALIECIHPEPLAKPDSPEMHREHFRLLRTALQKWMQGQTQPRGMPSYADFVAGVNGVLDHVRTTHTGNVLVVSSGGPISTAVGQVLGTTGETTIEMNLRIRNTSVTELVFTPKRHMLLSYNTLAHLETAQHRDWVTYA
ncbi:MAG: histidine phosphatase family protein [Burkholderiales bacterium]|jgi:broad specificity phosphatase PhoE|nr:histidine phosphatase family protein [Burkholderiales bacterium]